MEILVTALYIILCVLLFSLAVAIHEFGHFIAAIWLGLKVERFSIGFGPAIWKKTWKGVEYRISCIPLGGYVMIPDVDPEGTKKLEGSSAEKSDASREKIAPWKEIVVAVAGPAMNIVLAVVVAAGLSFLPSERFGQLPSKIGSFPEESVARDAGMKEGDVVISVGEHPISTWTDLMTEVQLTGGRPTEFTVRRAAISETDKMSFSVEDVKLLITPKRSDVTGAYYIQAFSVTNETKVGRWMPERNPLKQIAWDAGGIFRILKALVTPSEAAATGKALGGPVMIAEGIYHTVRNDFADGIGFFRFININLAVINLLPIPVLDGGIILFALIALIFRRRVPDRIVGVLSTGFMYLLLTLMGFLILRDSKRSWDIHRHAKDSMEAKMSLDSEKDVGGGNAE